jgi:hypothetical protein
MTKLLLSNPRGLSEIVSYVLLVVIAVGLSVAVYAFISVYIPKDKPTCPSDIFLGTTSVSCNLSATTTEVTVGLINKGLFTVDAAYIRVAREGREVKFQINKPNEAGSARGFYLYETGSSKPGLTPGKEVLYSYSVSSDIIDGAGAYTLEIQPAVGRGKNLALCEAGISSQPFTCA